jgi:hypothetical protein
MPHPKGTDQRIRGVRFAFLAIIDERLDIGEVDYYLPHSEINVKKVTLFDYRGGR